MAPYGINEIGHHGVRTAVDDIGIVACAGDPLVGRTAGHFDPDASLFLKSGPFPLRLAAGPRDRKHE